MPTPSVTPDAPRLRVSVRAAGGLVVRLGDDAVPRIVLVHNASDQEWSFPKGRQHRGERLLATALREVREETGFLCVAEAQAGATDHLDRRGRPKRTAYWVMRPVNGSFVPGGDVDDLAWLRPQEALVRLSQERNRFLLQASLAVIRDCLDRRQQDIAHHMG